MYLQNISIINYKNILSADLSLSPKLNCFIGDNGEGKTNFLDAVYYLSFCHSAYNSIDTQLITHDKDFFVLDGRYVADEETVEHIYCGMKRGGKKYFKRNDKSYKRLSQHIGLIPLIFVSPADTSLIIGGSEERRRLMDVCISQCDAVYLDTLNDYNKTLQQRNAMLKQEAEPDAALMDILEERMAADGEKIYHSREMFVEAIMPMFISVYQRISEDKETVSLQYVSHGKRGDLLDVIRSGRAKDRIMGYSLHGTHRDDLEMLIDGHPMKKEGSQGQHKTFVVAMKLAQYDYLSRFGHCKAPLLLLDDIFDRLDAHRVEQIVRLVSEDRFGQIFITDTNRDHLDKILRSGHFEHRLFEVKDGEFALRIS